MKNVPLAILFVGLLSGFLFTAGCTSLLNQQDVAFLSSLQEFENESVTRITQINENVKLEQWDTVRTDIHAYQAVIQTEIDHLNTLEVSEKVVPLREKAVLALQKQESILQSVEDLPVLNASVIPDLAGDYLTEIIKSVMTSAISGKE